MSTRKKEYKTSIIKRNSTRDYIKHSIISHMEELDTYKPEFDVIITVFADIVFQYNAAIRQFEKENMIYEIETAAGGTKKSGTASAIEVLRKDIGTYTDRLMLNPKALKDSLDNANSGSVLESVLSKFDKDG